MATKTKRMQRAFLINSPPRFSCDSAYGKAIDTVEQF
jgi:hypothetical protein